MLYSRDRRSGGRPGGLSAGRPAAVLVLAGALVLAGCASRRQMFDLQEDVQGLRADVDTLKYQLAGTGETLSAVEKDLRDLRTRSEYGSSALQEKVEALTARLDDITTRLDRTLAPLEEFLRKQASADSHGGGLGADYFDAAMRDLSAGNYDLAEVGFLQYIENYPQSDLADDARYGLAETYYARQRYNEAVEEYQRVVNMNPQGGKTPAAMLKLGLCYQALDKIRDARTAWEDLVKKFPYSEEARIAQQRLQETQGKP